MDLQAQLEELKETTQAKLAEMHGDHAKELQELRVQVLGKKGSLTELLKGLKELSHDMRPVVGKQVNEVRDVLTKAFEEQAKIVEAAKIKAQLESESLDVTLPGRHVNLGNRHVLTQTSEEIEDIFLGMGFIGKDARQGGLDTVQNHHTVKDVANIKATVKKAKVLVRVNPIHDAIPYYPSSKDEIDATIQAGADIVMLPFFKTVEEVKQFISYVDGRAKTLLLMETVEAANLVDEILEVPGVDMIHLGLNDMHLELGMKFMFELLANGTVEKLGKKIKAKGIPFGFGGIATLDGGALPGSMVLKEHVRLGSSMVIVSRSFCNTDVVTDLGEVKRIFDTGISGLRVLEKEASQADAAYLEENRKAVVAAVNKIAGTNYSV